MNLFLIKCKFKLLQINKFLITNIVAKSKISNLFVLYSSASSSTTSNPQTKNSRKRFKSSGSSGSSSRGLRHANLADNLKQKAEELIK